MMIDTNSIEFHTKYVNPYYGGLMGLNFMRKEIVDDSSEFLKSIISLKEDLSNDEIRQMLHHDNWRPTKVGAWIIGLCNMLELEKDLISFLKTRPNYCEHVIINLTIFNTQLGRKALNEFIYNQLEKILRLICEGKEYKAGDMFQKYSLLWAFNAIKYLDLMNHTCDFEKLLNSDIWLHIKKEWLRISTSNPRAIGFYNLFIEAENRDLGFVEAIKVINKS